MSTRTTFRLAALGLGLVFWGAAGQAAAPAPVAQQLAPRKALRPALSSLFIQLEDGRSFRLNQDDLALDRGGVIFWGDWAVYNLLVPFYSYHPDLPTKAADVVRLWNTPSASGELPAFLIKPQCIPQNPVAPVQATSTSSAKPWRPRILTLQVTLEDGRVHTLSRNDLDEPRSGVLFWSDFAVENILVPFYAHVKGLPTSATDAFNLWHGNAKGGPAGFTTTPAEEKPAFLIKPQCIPQYPLAGN